MKAPEPFTTHRWGIVGPHGNIWTPDTFESAEAALKHVADFWRGRRTNALTGYRAIPVSVTVVPLDVEQPA